jgi:hypothetical protein
MYLCRIISYLAKSGCTKVACYWATVGRCGFGSQHWTARRIFYAQFNSCFPACVHTYSHLYPTDTLATKVVRLAGRVAASKMPLMMSYRFCVSTKLYF